jgi:Sigma-70 region 2
MYDRALPQVYGYLRARVPGDALAEDLTAETFLAAAPKQLRRAAHDSAQRWSSSAPTVTHHSYGGSSLRCRTGSSSAIVASKRALHRKHVIVTANGASAVVIPS